MRPAPWNCSPSTAPIIRRRSLPSERSARRSSRAGDASVNDLGVVLPYWLDRPSAEALEIGRNADRLGYGELWVGEMLTFDAFALAGALAATTGRIRLTVGPLAVGVRDPVMLARGVASVALAGGRPAGLALGASSPTVVEQWHQRAWTGAAVQMRATLEAVRLLLAGDRHNDFR